MIRNPIAVHESGHAVVAHYYGMPLESVTLRKDTGTTLLAEGPRPAPLVYAAFAYAGMAAERLTGAVLHPRDHGAEKDIRAAFVKLNAVFGAEHFESGCDYFFETQRALVKSLAPHIFALAEQLESRGKLTGREVSTLLKACPRSSYTKVGSLINTTNAPTFICGHVERLALVNVRR